MDVRAERQADLPAIDELNRAAFGGTFEAELIARLRRDGLVAASLVAVADDGTVVGHILFSWLPMEVDGRAVRAVSLAPMAVAPEHQRRGIGSKLIAAGLDAMRDGGAEAVIVLGHPGYYPRFGFSAALAGKLASPFAGPAFMALELTPGALSGARGSVSYPSAFND